MKHFVTIPHCASIVAYPLSYWGYWPVRADLSSEQSARTHYTQQFDTDENKNDTKIRINRIKE